MNNNNNNNNLFIFFINILNYELQKPVFEHIQISYILIYPGQTVHTAHIQHLIWTCTPHYLGCIKRKSAFEHVQNVQIQIIMHMQKNHLGLCSPLIHSEVSNDSKVQANLGFCCLHMHKDMLLHGEAHLTLKMPRKHASENVFCCWLIFLSQRKSAFEHAQNVQIQIILGICKVSSRPLLYIHTFCSIQWFC